MCFSRVSLSIALSHLPKHILQHQASYTKLGTRIREFYLASISWRRTFHGYYSPFFGGYSSKSYQINISLIHSEKLLFGLWSVESMTISPCNNLYPRWGVIKLLESTIYLITVPFYFLNLYEEWAVNNFTESITL